MLPPELIQQFREVALERIARIEEAWTQVLVKLDDELSKVLHREVHTLKGESRVVGFTDVNLITRTWRDRWIPVDPSVASNDGTSESR